MTMSSRFIHAFRWGSTLLSLCVLFASSPASAEPAASPSPQEPPGLSLAVTPVYQLNSSLNNGGSVSVSRLLLDINGNKALSEQLGVGFHLAYDYADYHFSAPTTFGGGNPWAKLQRLELGGSVSYDLTPQWSLYVAPSLQFSRADDAGWGNALEYGGILSLSDDLTKDLTLGLGVGLFSELAQTTIFPVIVINWKITDKLLLANPFHPGPTGPAGVELAYKMDNGWSLGGGAAYRSNRFRLNNDAIGESNAVPAWLRLSRKVADRYNLDLYGGVMLGGGMSIDDRNGNRLTSTSVNPAPFLALALSAGFQ